MTMFDWRHCLAVKRSDEKVSGAWVFRGTRVPVKSLFENLKDGATLDDFLDWFPGVGREQVLAVLAFAEQSLTTIQQAAQLGFDEIDQGKGIVLKGKKAIRRFITEIEAEVRTKAAKNDG